MKHTSWLSGLAAVRRPRRRAWARTSSLVMSPPGRPRATARPARAWRARRTGPWPGRRPDGAPGGVGVGASPGRDPGVVAGGQAIEAEPVGPVQQAVELHGAVALDTGVRRPPRRVLAHVGRHDQAVELLGQVEDVVGDAELLGHPAGVLDVGHRAAARVGRAAPQLERGADHVMALLHQAAPPPPRSRRPRHGHEHPHGTSVPPGLSAPRRSAPTTAGTTSRARSTSASVVPYPSVKRRAPAASSGCDAHGGQDVAGLERPAGAGRPARDAHPLLPQRDQELLALDTRHAQVEVAREHLDAGGGRHRAVRPVHRAAAARRASRSRSAATRGPAAARSAATRRSAVASPTAPATSWVPLRRSRSCPPPYWRRLEPHSAGHGQRADADGPADLVRAERHQVGAGGDLGQVEVRRGLDGVGEDVGVRGAAAHRLDEVGQRLEHAGLVVGRHDGHDA